MPQHVQGAPPLGVVYDGDLDGWQAGGYAILPRDLRGRALTVAGMPGVGKTVLLRHLVAADAARGAALRGLLRRPRRPLRRRLELRRRRHRGAVAAGASRPRGRRRRLPAAAGGPRPPRHRRARKDRDDHGLTVYLDEFSAVSNGARAAIDLAERLRDAGVGVVFVVQSYEGLGDEHQAAPCSAARPR